MFIQPKKVIYLLLPLGLPEFLMLLFLKVSRTRNGGEMKNWLRSRTRESERKDKKSDVLKHLEGDLELLHAGMRVAENAVDEGSTDLGEVMGKKL